MKEYFKNIIKGVKITDDIEKSSQELLLYHDLEEVAVHSLKVANEAKRIAKLFGLDVEASYIAGCLHDISKVIPNEKRVQVCKDLGIEVFEEEKICPSLLHQRLSMVISREVFGVADTRILSAIECHSTLRKGAKDIDLLLLVADKLQWDSEDNKVFRDKVISMLDLSLEKAAYEYLKHMLDNKENMEVVHPWIMEGYSYLGGVIETDKTNG